MCCCFGSKTPQLRRLGDKENEWSVETIQINIEAIPYATSQAKVDMLLERIDYYSRSLSDIPERTSIQERGLGLLRELRTLANKQLPIITANASDDTSVRINGIFQAVHKQKKTDALSMQHLKTIRDELTYCEKELKSVNSLIEDYTKQYKRCKKHLHMLEELYSKAKQAIESPSHNPSGSVTLNKDIHAASKMEIEARISSGTNEDIQKVVEGLRRELNIDQSKILQATTDLNFWRPHQQTWKQNIDRLNQLEDMLSQQLAALLASTEKTENDDQNMVELEQVSSPSALQEHKIRGKTKKTYVALTEVK